MNKKPKTVNKTKPRRTKGRVYSLPEANRAIIDALSDAPLPTKVLTPETLDAAVASARANQIITEDICSKARRLANEAEETKKKKRAERELAFMKRMFETEDLAGAGVVMDKVREDGTIEYLICGRRWVYGESLRALWHYDGYLVNIDDYLGFSLCHDWSPRVSDLSDFGKALKRMDEREAELRAKYPENLWGWFKSKWV